jgi:hypothetical protein
MTLTEFLLARIAEDEAFARTVPGDGEFCTWNRSWDMSPTRDLVVDGKRVAALSMTMDEHICRWDPARVLAECEAKRVIVALSEHGCGDDYERVQQALALPYAAHAGYRQEWRKWF